jgi:hypothetical protein
MTFTHAAIPECHAPMPQSAVVTRTRRPRLRRCYPRPCCAPCGRIQAAGRRRRGSSRVVCGVFMAPQRRPSNPASAAMAVKAKRHVAEQANRQSHARVRAKLTLGRCPNHGRTLRAARGAIPGGSDSGCRGVARQCFRDAGLNALGPHLGAATCRMVCGTAPVGVPQPNGVSGLCREYGGGLLRHGAETSGNVRSSGPWRECVG